MRGKAEAIYLRASELNNGSDTALDGTSYGVVH